MTDRVVELGIGGPLDDRSPETDGWGGQDPERVRELGPPFARRQACRGSALDFLACLLKEFLPTA